MTDLKITGTPTASAKQALEPHIKRIYDRPGIDVLAIVEMRHTKRVQPAPNSDIDSVVHMQIVGCEVPNEEQTGPIRTAMRALYLARTARGTLDEEGQLELDKETLKHTAGELMWIECARLRAGLAVWTTYAQRVVSQSAKLTTTEIAHELQAVADGLTATLQQAAREVED